MVGNLLRRLERWPSGRRRSTRNRVGPKRVSRVQIPLSPPMYAKAWATQNREQKLCIMAFAKEGFGEREEAWGGGIAWPAPPLSGFSSLKFFQFPPIPRALAGVFAFKIPLDLARCTLLLASLSGKRPNHAKSAFCSDRREKLAKPLLLPSPRTRAMAISSIASCSPNRPRILQRRLRKVPLAP
jgi:hypothetical protein